MSGRNATFRGDVALLACALFWGATFPALRQLLQDVSPLLANAIRFGLAGLLLLPGALRASGRGGHLWGLALGLSLGGGYALQTVALTEIGAARSAFLTALYVLITPLLEWALRRGRPPWGALGGGTLALAGIAVMAGPGALRAGLSVGDLMTIGAAALFAGQIIGVASALARVAAPRLLFGQIATCAVASAGGSLLIEAPRFHPSPVAIGCLLYLSVVATAFVFALQAYGQRRTTPGRAAILFATEPLWAALLAAALGEPATARELAGGALVLAGVLAGTLPRSLRAAQPSAAPGSGKSSSPR